MVPFIEKLSALAWRINFARKREKINAGCFSRFGGALSRFAGVFSCFGGCFFVSLCGYLFRA